MASRSMRSARLVAWLVAFATIAHASCGDDDADVADTGTPLPPPPPMDGGPADTGSPAPDIGAPDTAPRDSGPPGPTIALSGRVSDFLGGGPVAELRMCIYELPDLPCASTGADGMYVLPGVPAMTELRLTYRDDAERWQPTMVHIATPDTDINFNFVAIDLLVAEGLAMDAGIEIDPTKALVVFNAFGPGSEGPVAGVTATLEPDDAEARAFISDTFAVDATLTATSTVGVGFFANVPEGPHTLTYAHPDRDCRVLAGWAGSTQAEAPMQVVAGWFVSPGSATCVSR